MKALSLQFFSSPLLGANVNGTCFQIPKNSRPFSGKGFHVYLRISRILETGKTGEYMNKRIT
jgi:hypothetical protein